MELYAYEEVKAKLEKFTKFDLKRTDLTIEYLKFELAQIIQPFLVGIIGANFPKVYRCRTNGNKGLFCDIKELWYPPKENIKEIGRFNNIGEQVFYCAVNEIGAVNECYLDIGETITILQCELIDKNRQLKIANMFLDDFKDVEGIIVNVNSIQTNFQAQSILQTRNNICSHAVIQKFLECESVKRVKKGEEYRYKTSVAIKDIFWTIEDLDGICYPSVAIDKQNINFALRPSAADNNYKPIKVWVMKKILHEGEESLQCINISKEIDYETGKVTYQN